MPGASKVAPGKMAQKKKNAFLDSDEDESEDEKPVAKKKTPATAKPTLNQILN